MTLILEVVFKSSTLHIYHHSHPLRIYKKYLQILISPIFLWDDRCIKKEMWQKALHFCYANYCAKNIQKLEIYFFCGFKKGMFGEMSNKVLINLSQYEMMVGRLLRWSKEPVSIHTKGTWLIDTTTGGKDLGMYNKYILQQKWRRKQKSTSGKFPPG